MSGGVSLLLCRDTAHPPGWTELWARAYPQTYTVECRSQVEQDAVAACFAQIPSGGRVFAVCQGMAVAAFLRWYYGASYRDRQRICGMILVPSPFCTDDDDDLLRRVRCTVPAALVAADAAAADSLAFYADCWGARLLLPPPEHSPLCRGGTWEWGMRLMQEMLLAN